MEKSMARAHHTRGDLTYRRTIPKTCFFFLLPALPWTYVNLTPLFPFHISVGILTPAPRGQRWPWGLCAHTPYQLQLLQPRDDLAEATLLDVVLGLASSAVPQSPPQPIALQSHRASTQPLLGRHHGLLGLRMTQKLRGSRRGVVTSKLALLSLMDLTGDFWRCLPSSTPLQR